jgi:hypothetical protein
MLELQVQYTLGASSVVGHSRWQQGVDSRCVKWMLDGTIFFFCSRGEDALEHGWHRGGEASRRSVDVCLSCTHIKQLPARVISTKMVRTRDFTLCKARCITRSSISTSMYYMCSSVIFLFPTIITFILFVCIHNYM